MGKLKEAEPLRRRGCPGRHQERARTIPAHSTRMRNYASLLVELGRFEEAADWATRSMEAHLRVLGFKHPSTQNAILLAIQAMTLDHKDDSAIRITDRMLEQARRELEPDDSRDFATPASSRRLAQRAGRPRRCRVGRRGAGGGPDPQAGP